MDYQQHMPGRSSYDPSRSRGQMHREGGIGGVLLLVGIIVAALALVIWMASSNTEGVAPTPPDAVATEPAAVPADTGEAAPAATE